MLKINYSNKDFNNASDNEEDDATTGHGHGESLEPLAKSNDVVEEPTQAPSVESADNTKAKDELHSGSGDEILDENPAASSPDAGQEDESTGDSHVGLYAPLGVASDAENNVDGFAEAYTEANLDGFNGAGFSPYTDIGYNPYADAGINPYGDAGLNQYGDTRVNPFAFAGPNPFGITGPNPYASFGLNPYALAGLNPYGLGSLNPYAFPGGINPYAFTSLNPYTSTGLNPYAIGCLNPYALGGGLNSYGSANSNQDPEADRNNFNAETTPNPYAEVDLNLHDADVDADADADADTDANNKEPNTENESSDVFDLDLLFKHPLQNTWTLWYLENDRTKSWQEMQNEITSFDTVEDFWSLYNYIKPPSDLKMGSDYSLFKRNIRPMWEDEANKHGGRWVITLNKSCKIDLDNLWLDVLLCLIGEAFDYSDEVCGAVVNIRGKNNKISIWTSNGNMEHAAMEIGRKLCDALCLGRHKYLQYQLHTDTMIKQGSNVHSIYTL